MKLSFVPQGAVCFPWISFCSDRLPPNLTSHLWGRTETGTIRLSERKENYNILGHYYSPIIWVSDTDRASQQGRLKFYSLVGMKGRQRKRGDRGNRKAYVVCPGVFLCSQNWNQYTMCVWAGGVYIITYLALGGQLPFRFHSIT